MTYERITELVVVCCHAICHDPKSPYDEASWHLQSFQRSNRESGKVGEHETFMLHGYAGLSALRRLDTLVIFSGGKTRKDSELSEAESYCNALLEADSPLGAVISKAISDGRCATENLATDSYQNLLFSIIEFYKITSKWPEMITIVTHAFKQERFLVLFHPRGRTHSIRLQTTVLIECRITMLQQSTGPFVEFRYMESTLLLRVSRSRRTR